MKIRAVIFDVYKTLLEVGPPPVDADQRWSVLCREYFGPQTGVTLAELNARVEAVIAREHAQAKAVGIPKPEIYWPDVAKEALPELAALSSGKVDDFLFAHAQLQRTVRLMSGAAEVLKKLIEAKTLLGIASNAQPYTLRELKAALRFERLDMDIFRPDLMYWSFAGGFSKPDPHVFRLLTARLAALGVRAVDTLMVGDRADNDITPARAQGWQTWHIVSAPGDLAQGQGDWVALDGFLSHSRA